MTFTSGLSHLLRWRKREPTQGTMVLCSWWLVNSPIQWSLRSGWFIPGKPTDQPLDSNWVCHGMPYTDDIPPRAPLGSLRLPQVGSGARATNYDYTKGDPQLQNSIGRRDAVRSYNFAKWGANETTSLVIHNTKASVFEDQCWSTTASLGKNGCELTETPIAGFRFFRA